jgi:DNA-binding transcriptional LysR family regulator
MELWQLRYFLAVAEELGFHGAARRLRVSQPPVSRAVRGLEEELGAPLFERTRRGVSLTPAGRVLDRHARELLSAAERAAAEVRRLQRGEAGRLRVAFEGAIATAVLPRAVAAFRELHPDVELVLLEIPTPRQAEALAAHEVELAFGGRGASVAAPAVAKGLRVLRTVRQPLVAAVPRAHALARRRAVAPADLAGLPLVAASPHAFCALHDRVAAIFRDANGAEPRAVVDVNETDLALRLVGAGLGFAVVPAGAAEPGRRDVAFLPFRPEQAIDVDLLARIGEEAPLVERFVAALDA